ncbi:MAG: hypothetical protein JWN87_1308, partial [Frankiales bacterium]|nr:hypothetical protein [Frankiales bacterium]
GGLPATGGVPLLGALALLLLGTAAVLRRRTREGISPGRP